MPDPIFPAVYELAMACGQPATMPTALLANSAACVDVVESVEENVMRRLTPIDYRSPTLKATVDRYFDDWAANQASVPGVSSASDRKCILLRLWLGCLGVAKMIKNETNDGDILPPQRADSIGQVDALAATCPIIRAGDIYAVDLMRKRHAGMALNFDGVPATSTSRTRL